MKRPRPEDHRHLGDHRHRALRRALRRCAGDRGRGPRLSGRGALAAGWRRCHQGARRDLQQGSAEHIATVIDEIIAERPGGRRRAGVPARRARDPRRASGAVAAHSTAQTEVLPLYARLSATEQDRVFKPGPKRRVVLATNVAETSLTVPRIRYVIDTGTARVKRYSQRSQLERLHVEPISQAAADQRKGRCGRVGPGICVRLYDEADFASRAALHRSGTAALVAGQRDPAHAEPEAGRGRGFPVPGGARAARDRPTATAAWPRLQAIDDDSSG